MNHRPPVTRLVVGQHVYCRPLKRAAQLMAVTSSNGTCTVRFHDDNSVAVIHADELRLATWDEMRYRDPKARAAGSTRNNTAEL